MAAVTTTSDLKFYRKRSSSIKGNHSSKRNKYSVVVSIVTVFLVVLVAFSYLHPTIATTTNIKMTSQQQQPAVSLLVTLTFTQEQHKQQFLHDIAPVAAHVEQHEPNTLAYQVLQSDKDDLQILILERYTDKNDAYLKVHKSSPQFLEFRAKLQKLVEGGFVTIDGHSYVDNVGFVGR